MGKPTVAIHTPKTLFAGGLHELEVEVTADTETKVEQVDATLTAIQGWAIAPASRASRSGWRGRYASGG